LQAKGGASDLVQETFLKAQAAFARFEGDSDEDLRAWLRQVLLNTMIDFERHYRQTGKRQLGREVALDGGDSSSAPGNDPSADTSSPSARAMKNEDDTRVQQALARLPEDYRQVLTMRYQDDLSFEEIGWRLGRTGNAARKLWLRAVEKLEQELGSPP
jgi:RNA polymerase sigma-70 factor (ECF subfamily)